MKFENFDIERQDKIVRSKKYLDWLVQFTKTQPDKCWGDEDITYSNNVSNNDKIQANLLYEFQKMIIELAHKQFVLSMPTYKYEYFKYQFKLRGNYYETIKLYGSNSTSIIRQIDAPNNNFVYVDEKAPIDEKKKRELIEFIIINDDLKLSAAQYAVHISRVAIKSILKEQNSDKFKIWYQDGTNQKQIILKANEEILKSLESQGFVSSHDTGHRDIPKNALVTVSLGIMSRDEALNYTKNCELWN